MAALWAYKRLKIGMGFLSNLLNGALGQPSPLEFEQIPPDEEVYPDDGLIRAPEFPIERPLPRGGIYLGPEFTCLVHIGSKVVGGQPVAEIEASAMVLEVIAPCSGVVEEILVQNGAVVADKQPLIKLAMP